MLDFPNTPNEGDVHTEKGATWTYRSGAWVLGAKEGTNIQIVDEGSSYQIVGSKMIYWGEANTDTNGHATFTFPRAFKDTPVVTAVSVGDANWNVTQFSISTTETVIKAIGAHTNAPAGAGLQIRVHAIGDVPDGEEMPTKVIGRSGDDYLSRVATDPQNVAGFVEFDTGIEVGGTVDINTDDFPPLRVISPSATSGIKGWSMFSHPTENNAVDSLRFEWWDDAITYGGIGLRVGTSGISVQENVRIYVPITTAGSANVHMDANGYMRKFTSLAEYKENVAPVVSAIDALNPVTFDSKHEADEGARFAGFIAEEVWQAIPEAKQPDGYDQNAIIAHLVKEVQELRRRLDDLGG